MSRGSDELKAARSRAVRAYHAVTTPAEEQAAASVSMVLQEVQTPLLSGEKVRRRSAPSFSPRSRGALTEELTAGAVDTTVHQICCSV